VGRFESFQIRVPVLDIIRFLQMISPLQPIRPPVDTASLEKEIESLRKKSFWQRTADYLFGYDFFVCYSWEDGAVYAVGLANALTDRGFDCFLDSRSYAKGDDWKAVGSAAIQRTSQLVLVGSPGALQSAAVLLEVRIFSSSGRKVIPIDFGGTVDS